MVPAGIKAFAAPTRGPRAHEYLGFADVAPPAAVRAGAVMESSHRVTSALGAGVLAQLDRLEVKVGRCRLTASNPVLKLESAYRFSA
jgi:hypothetical protein